MDVGKIIRYHTKAVLFITLTLFIGGVFTALRLPVSLFPDIAFPRIVVNADAGDMPAERMMITVTRKLEEAVNSIPDVVSVRSTTSRGATELSINFHWNIDMIKAELMVNNAINQIRSELPANFRFLVRRMNPTVYPIIGYSLISDTEGLVELRNFAEYTLRPVLTSIDGVANVVVLGGRTREYQVVVNPERLRSFDLSMSDLIQAIQNTNVIGSVGKVEQDYQLYLTLVDGQYRSPEEIGHTVVKFYHQMPIFLDDVAVIKTSRRPEWTRVTSNGHEAVLLNVYQQPGGNTVKIAAEIKQTLASMQNRIPRDIKLSKFYDQSDLIVESMKNVRDSIFVGVVLAVLILFAFLRNWKITLIASLNVPLTIGITILLMGAFHMSLNIMTLGGMAAAIGLIIDDAIVVVENIIRHLALRHQRPSAAVHASLREIFHPILGSSFSTIVVFAPLAFLTGVTGAFFKSLSLTMAMALLVSMLISVFFIPILSRRLISERDAQKQETSGRLFRLVHNYYERILRFLFRRKYVAFVLAGLLFGSTYFLYKGMPSGFLPEMDEGTFILDYRTPAGTSLSETNRVMMQIEQILMQIPEVESYSRRTGLQLGGSISEANVGDFLVRLKGKRKRNIQEVIDDVRSRVLKNVPGVEIEFAQLMGDLIGDLTAVPQPIEIKIFGDDYPTIHAVSRQVVAVLKTVPGVVDMYRGVTIAGSGIEIRVDNVRAGLFGLTAEDIRKEVQAAVNGTVASEVQDKQYMTGVRVWFPRQQRLNLERIKRLRIHSPRGGYVSLSSVAKISILKGQPELTRENLKQMIAVTARISGRDMGSTLRDIRRGIKRRIQLPPDVFIKFGGLYREQQKSFRGLLVVLIMAILLVFSVQLLEFESFKVPFVILITDLLSLFGVFLLLRITHIPLNISSLMGLIMIVGIVAENAIFLIHYIQLFRSQGQLPVEAVIKAGKVRMRPVLMTTLAAVLALMPLAIGIGAGAQMQQPLAVAVIGGFSLSAILLLFLLPVFYIFAFGRSPFPAGERIKDKR